MTFRSSAAAALARLLRRVVAGRTPNFVIGGSAPYMLRWYLVPRNRLINVYLHLLVRDDGDRELHDHRGDNLSLVLEEGYVEHVPLDPARPTAGTRAILRPPGAVVLRRGEDPHRITLLRTPSGELQPALSLFLMLRPHRRWGFHCPGGWVPWEQYLARRDSTEGGCG